MNWIVDSYQDISFAPTKIEQIKRVFEERMGLNDIEFVLHPDLGCPENQLAVKTKNLYSFELKHNNVDWKVEGTGIGGFLTSCPITSDKVSFYYDLNNYKIYVRPVAASRADLGKDVVKDKRTKSVAPKTCIVDTNNKNKFFFQSKQAPATEENKKNGILTYVIGFYGISLESLDFNTAKILFPLPIDSGTGVFIVNINHIPMYKGKSGFSWGGVNISKGYGLKLKKATEGSSLQGMSNDFGQGVLASIYYECDKTRLVL